MKLKVIKVDKSFSKKREVEIKLNELVDVYLPSWKKPGDWCIIKKNGVNFWYPKDCLIELNILRSDIFKDLGI